MTSAEWLKIKHFWPAEFDSPDEPDSGVRMRYEIVKALDDLRTAVGFPLLITSGIRTEKHNLEVGGVDGSAHVDGWAADISCRTSNQRYHIVKALLSMENVKRIGIAKTFIHVDCDPLKPSSVIWLY